MEANQSVSMSSATSDEDMFRSSQENGDASDENSSKTSEHGNTKHSSPPSSSINKG